MSVDLQVVFPQSSIQLNSVRLLDGFRPKTLDVTGLDFRSVDEVMINGVLSPSIVVLSKTRLLAQVPDLMTSSIVTSVTVTSKQLTVTEKSFMQFRLSKAPGKVRGILRLIQLFLKILFTTPGTDIFSKRIGGGGLRSLGKTFGHDQGGSIVSNFVVAVDTTTRQIIAVQGRDSSVPQDERLLNAKVLAANFNYDEAALIVSVEITSQAGRAAVANVLT